ncbi:hypothetical protein ACWEIJ_45905 [Lentzea sp. NPDC004789]
MTVDTRVVSCSGTRVNVYTMMPGAAAMFELLIAAHNHDSDEAAGWKVKGMILRPKDRGDVRIVGDLLVQSWADVNSASWLVEVSADAVSQSLQVAVSGEETKVIGWVARLTTAELTF